ncbi:MAG: GNAT family N-acetyltransferase [Thermoanaerobaculia bacterium]
MVEVVEATGEGAIREIRELFLEYQRSLDVDLCFQGFQEELDGLPGPYGPPDGRLLLALQDGRSCGCVALQSIGDGSCEMKRLYVRPEARGAGLGEVLVTRVLEAARSLAYHRVCLDTLPSMQRAAALYESLGFRDIPPYRPNPIPGTRFMALDL